MLKVVVALLSVVLMVLMQVQLLMEKMRLLWGLGPPPLQTMRWHSVLMLIRLPLIVLQLVRALKLV